MAAYEQLKKRTRGDYGYLLDYRTRWSDNDMYHHVNNSIYNILFDSIVNSFLIQKCGFSPQTSPQYGLVVQSHIDFFGSFAFPDVAELGLRVKKLGKASVTYEIGLFVRGDDKVKAVGELTHVFVDRETGRPAEKGLSGELRKELETILFRDVSSRL